MTMVDAGMFAHAAVIGWLALLFIVPSALSSWRPYALALVLGGACLMLSWWFGGPAGARVAALGLTAGACGAISIRFDPIVRR
jgi:hypothetical protein